MKKGRDNRLDKDNDDPTAMFNHEYCKTLHNNKYLTYFPDH